MEVDAVPLPYWKFLVDAVASRHTHNPRRGLIQGVNFLQVAHILTDSHQDRFPSDVSGNDS